MKKTNKKGFTLVELVIVVAVMAILVAVAIPTVGTITKTAQSATDESNARTIESMIKLYEAKKDETTDGKVTVTAEDCVKACEDAKLGITKANFYYIVKSGDVVATKPTSGTAGTEYFVIAFDADGAVSNSEYSSTSKTSFVG